MDESNQLVGSSPIRKEGRDKVTGRAQYVDDLSLPGMWFGATVRSTIARGRITSITFDPLIPWHEFTVVTAKDIPGENAIVHLAKDHVCLAESTINHCDEPILLLAHPERAVLHAAVAAVKITYDELPGVFTIEDSETAIERAAQGDTSGVIWGKGADANLFKTYLMQKDQKPIPADVWETADYIVEGEYRTGAQEQLYIENNGVIAEYSATDGVTVRGSMQCPFYLVHALEVIFGLPAERCRVIQRVRRQGRLPFRHRQPRRAAGDEERPPRKDLLRPRRRYGRHDEASSEPYSASHGGQQGRQTAGG